MQWIADLKELAERAKHERKGDDPTGHRQAFFLPSPSVFRQDVMFVNQNGQHECFTCGRRSDLTPTTMAPSAPPALVARGITDADIELGPFYCCTNCRQLHSTFWFMGLVHRLLHGTPAPWLEILLPRAEDAKVISVPTISKEQA